MASNYYEILGIPRSSSADEIKRAFRKLAVTYHPDKNPGDKKAEERFKEINEAYAVLSDPQKRKQYDQFGDAGFHQRFSQEDIFRGFDVGDLFKEAGLGGDDLFSRLFGSGRHGGRSRGRDLQQSLTITFREAYDGCEKRLKVQRGGSSEEIVVRVPAGIADGAKLHVAGKGEGGSGGGPAGSLYLQIKVMNDPIFSRDGDDIIVERAIPFSEAALGTSLDVPTLEGNKRIRVPAGIQPGTRIRLAGFGFPR
ncbi:MAG TPA: DnaJ C-terminal domain-containing protein, partial [Geobacterales bacterium]|nr:DnaJ C-terminal domain-containing protein [Geobacterales bacterium]